MGIKHGPYGSQPYTLTNSAINQIVTNLIYIGNQFNECPYTMQPYAQTNCAIEESQP